MSITRNYKRGILLLIGAAFILIMATSSIVMINIQNQEVLSISSESNPDVVILQSGTTANVQLAVDTFMQHYTGNVQIQIISGWRELQQGILSFPDARHVVYGHGIEEGLVFEEGKSILPWKTLRDFIIVNGKWIAVMACYSEPFDMEDEYELWYRSFYFGYEGIIDAEWAGFTIAAAFADLKYDGIEIVRSHYRLLNEKLEHPLIAANCLKL